ncbi:MAG: asparagine synthetase B [Candidatus Diapherotrites archaeon]
MCGIFGILSKTQKPINEEAEILAQSLNKRGPDGFGIYTHEKTNYYKHETKIKLEETTIALGHCLLSTTGFGKQPMQEKETAIAHNGTIYNYQEFCQEKKAKSDSYAILEFITTQKQEKKETNLDFLKKTLKEFSKKAIGEYAIGIMKEKDLFAFRDFTGQKPVWYGETKNAYAFASEPNALKKIGVDYTQPLIPGNLLQITKKGFKTHKVYNLKDFIKEAKTKKTKETLKQIFEKTIEMQTKNINKAAILFSGGIDSSLIAKTISEKVQTKLFVAGTKESHDLKEAKQTAKEIGLELIETEIEENQAKEIMIECTTVIPFCDKMQLALAITEMTCAKAIKKENIRVVFTGQGSDELFCGYNSYLNTLKKEGYEGIEKEIEYSTANMWARNFAREDAIFANQSLEIRLPFFAQNMIKKALSIKAKEKIKSEKDMLRKHPIRELAKQLGLKEQIYTKQKKSMQYGSGTQKIIEKLLNEKKCKQHDKDQ